MTHCVIWPNITRCVMSVKNCNRAVGTLEQREQIMLYSPDMNRRVVAVGLILTMLIITLVSTAPAAAIGPAVDVSRQDVALDELSHLVQPGDTWAALAWRYGVGEETLRAANPHPNVQHQPAIGQRVVITGPAKDELAGLITNSDHGGLLQVAATTGARPWTIALINQLTNPFRPLLYRTIFLPGGNHPPKQFPPGIRALEVSQAPALPGQALAIRGLGQANQPPAARFAGAEMAVSSAGSHFIALIGTGAFFEPGQYPLEIVAPGQPLWSQPWMLVDGEWTYEEITYTGQAASIDAETIRQERQRLDAIWNQVSDWPFWSGAFLEPIQDFLGYSSLYGARRSYGGGPYDRYHEGLDFSAYGGTAVYAPAAGQVVLAEQLAARGGAVIIDHGLGVFTGYYHLSEVLADPGQTVASGGLIGRVGSTGLSTGNHLHWDLLVGGVWVDPAGWRVSRLPCWLLEGLGESCPAL